MSRNAPPTVRASHVNTGTSVLAAELPWPDDTDKPVFGLPKLHMEIDRRSEVTPYGGLALATQVAFLLKMPKILNRHVSVLKRHRPYHASDHVLAEAFNLFNWDNFRTYETEFMDDDFILNDEFGQPTAAVKPRSYQIGARIRF